MKNYEAELMLQALNALSNSNTTLPTLTGYRILVDKNKLETTIKPYLDMRDNIIMKYDKSGTVTKETPGFDKCLQELNAIGNEEAENVTLTKIRLKDLKDTKIPVNLLNAIMPIIDDTEEKDGK